MSADAGSLRHMVEPEELRGRLPKEWVTTAARRYGEREVATWCADLLRRRVGWDDPDRPSLGWLGGPAALDELGVGRLAERGVDHWPRVWAARGLLYVWDPAAGDAVSAVLGDPAWRVREMAARVIRRRELGAAADLLPALTVDPVPRVRSAGARALGHVGGTGAADAIRPLLDDVDGSVRDAAERALAELGRRLDRAV